MLINSKIRSCVGCGRYKLCEATVAAGFSPSDWMKAERKEWRLGCWEPSGCLVVRDEKPC